MHFMPEMPRMWARGGSTMAMPNPLRRRHSLRFTVVLCATVLIVTQVVPPFAATTDPSNECVDERDMSDVVHYELAKDARADGGRTA